MAEMKNSSNEEKEKGKEKGKEKEKESYTDLVKRLNIQKICVIF